MKNNITRVVFFSLFCVLSAYSHGAAMMDYFLVYPSRGVVGEKEFVIYQTLLSKLILPILVVPFVVVTLLNVLLLWYRPSFVSARLLRLSLGCLIINWLSSALVQIPINLELHQGKNMELIQQAMDTNWGRIIWDLHNLLLFSSC